MKKKRNNLSAQIIGHSHWSVSGLLSLFFVGALLVGLEVLVETGILQPSAVPKPSQVLMRFWNLLNEGATAGGDVRYTLLEHVLWTSARIIPMVMLGSLCGYLIALGMLVIPALRGIAWVLAIISLGIPATALLLVLQLWDPFGEVPKFLIMFLKSFAILYFYIFWRGLTLLREVDSGRNDGARQSFMYFASEGASRWQLLKLQLIPRFVEGYFQGLVIAVFAACMITVVSEGSGYTLAGIGSLLRSGAEHQDEPLLFAGVLLLMLYLGSLWSLVWLTKKATLWYLYR